MRVRILATLFSMFVCISCAGAAKDPTVNTVRPDVTHRTQDSNSNVGSPLVSDYCEQWEKLRSELDKNHKADLEKYGIVIGGPGYLLSPKIISDCELRIKVGGMIRKVIQGEASEADRKFSLENSKSFVSVLMKIWDSEGFSYDGVRHEKYQLVNYVGFKEEDNATFLSYLLTTKVLNASLVYSLLERPIKSLSPLLTKLKKRAKKTNNLAEHVCLLIILAQTTKDRAIILELDALAKGSKFNESNRRALLAIVKKFKTAGSIRFSDVEDLSLGIPDLENLSFEELK